MLGFGNRHIITNIVASTAMLAMVQTASAIEAGGTPLTGKLMMKKLSHQEFVMFVTGMVEGMAYARFRKDSLEAGEKHQEGMDCIRNWYHQNPKSILKIQKAFDHFSQYEPWVVLGILLKKECSE